MCECKKAGGCKLTQIQKLLQIKRVRGEQYFTQLSCDIGGVIRVARGFHVLSY